MKRIGNSLKALAPRRRIFISYAAEDRAEAERIALSLRGRDLDVFLDKDDLPPAGDYDSRIYQAIQQSSGMVFLISPASVTDGRYTLTELKFARQKWPHPKGHVLPVMLVETTRQGIPAYLGAVTVLRPQGNVAAEVSAEVSKVITGRKLITRGLVAGAGAAAAACVVAYASLGNMRVPTVPAGTATYAQTSGTPGTVAADAGQAKRPAEDAQGGPLAFPPRLDLKFSVEIASGENPNLYSDQIVLAVRSPPQDNERQALALQDDGFYLIKSIETPRSNAPFLASVARRVKNSFASPQIPPTTAICLHRRDEAPLVAVKHQAILRCKEGDQPCNRFDDADPGWLAVGNICRTAGPRNPASLWPATRLTDAFVSRAWAAAGRVWTVPSLETLMEERSQNRLRDGFTTFNISAEKLNVDADAMSLDLTVDGTSVLIEGLPADLQRRRLDPATRFTMQFALQNLGFSGRFAGCDKIDARLLLYKQGDPAGEPIILPLHYAAMRDVDDTNVVTDRGKFTWSAKYELATPRDPKALSQADWRIFLKSAPVAELDRLQKAQDAFSRLGLVYNDGERAYPVVAILRPPLTGSSFGLALGLVLQTGQVRFTFPRPVADKLKAFAQDERTKSPAARNLIDESPALFIERSDVSRRYACAPAR